MYNTKPGEILGLSDDKDHKPWLEDNPDRVKNYHNYEKKVSNNIKKAYRKIH